MAPLTLLAAQKLLGKLVTADALQQKIMASAAEQNLAVPAITSGQVVLSSASPDLGDKNIQLTYPRVCIYSSGAKNTQIEKFRAFSGYVGLVTEIWASANLVDQADQWIHFYAQSVAGILQNTIGDWGDGMFYSGVYDIQLQPPKIGGFGFVESARLVFPRFDCMLIKSYRSRGGSTKRVPERSWALRILPGGKRFLSYKPI